MTGKSQEERDTALGRFRGACYLLLSRTFSRELDADALKGMEEVSGSLLDAWELMEMPADPDVQTGKALLDAFFSELLRESLDTVVERLATQYAVLFLGVGPRTISPCESVHRSESGTLYQPTVFEVMRSYGEIGMAKDDEYHEPDDHIAVELMFMARLCEMMQEAGERGQALHYLSLQQEFLQQHLVLWVGRFSDELIAAAPAGFYRAMGYLLKGYVRIDSTLIGSMIRKLNVTGGSKEDRKNAKN